MNYMTELHCHTAEVSQCAHMGIAETVRRYIAKGFDTLVLTEHFSTVTFDVMKDKSWQEKCDYFLSTYNEALRDSDGKINILLAMEFRNIYSNNDYLVYGVTEEFIRDNNTDDSHNLIGLHLKDFTELAHNYGMLVYQAHPFRNGMTVINPSYLDGIEICNGHRRHDSRNDIAAMWAAKFGLLTCGGSDCHEEGDEASVALVTDYEITDNATLIKALKDKVNLVTPED